MELLKKLKEFLLKNKCYEIEEKKEFSNSFGDIVLAKYVYEDLTDRNGQLSIAPFIVLEDRGEDLLCVKGSRNIKNNVSKPKILNLKSDKYNINNDTYFYLSRIRKIEKNRLIKNMDTLKENEKFKLLAKLNILINRNYTFVDFPKLPEYSARIGDVINNLDNKYLIIEEKEDKYLCFALSRTLNVYDDVYVDLDGHYYHINFDVIYLLDKEKNKKNIIGDVSKNELLTILKEFNEYQSYLENKQYYLNHIKIKKLSRNK